MKKKTGGKKVTITASNDKIKVSASWKVTSMKGIVKKVKITGTKTVKAGKSLKLKANVTATKKANKKLQWTSSNTKLKSVYLIATRDLSNLWLQFFLSQNQGFMRLFEKTVLK